MHPIEITSRGQIPAAVFRKFCDYAEYQIQRVACSSTLGHGFAQIRSSFIWAFFGLILQLNTTFATPVIILGPADGLAFDQPRVAVEVYELNPIHSFGPEFFNTFLLDTGANGLMAAGYSVTEMEALGYLTEAFYDEQGIAGSEEFGVSKEYELAFAGSDYIPKTLSFVRLLSNDSISIGFDGIIGMPAMVNRVIKLDMTPLALTDPDNYLMGVEFASELTPDNGHQYHITLELVEFEQTGQQDPCDPLPSWAPLPFVQAKVSSLSDLTDGSFLLDTGAQISVISTDLAVALGLDKNGNGIIDRDENGNGIFDPNEEAVAEAEFGGIGGSIMVPLVALKILSLPTNEGIDLLWSDPIVAVVDISGIPGILGMDIFTSGWFEAAFGGDDGYIQLMQLDFRQANEMTATMHLDITAALDVVQLAPPGGATVYDLTDFAFFAHRWLRDNCQTSIWCDGADFNKDTIVDHADLSVLKNHWIGSSGP